MYYQIHKTNYKDVYWPTTPCKKITFEFVTFVGGYWGLREGGWAGTGNATYIQRPRYHMLASLW